MKVENGCVVSISYKLRNKAGEVIGSSPEGEPLVFVQRARAIIPGLEAELSGREAGSEFSAVVEPEDAYGEINPCLYAVLKREVFSGIDVIEPGMQFQTTDENGNSQVIRVMVVEGDEVTVDRNHPLAGKTLYFDVTIVSVEPFTD